MKPRRDLLESIADTIKDYRVDDLPEPTPDHVDKWIRQFEPDVQRPMLHEMDHVLRQTYFSKAAVLGIFERVIKNVELTNGDPHGFWRSAHLLDIQQDGNSQADIRRLFCDAVKRQWGLTTGAGECVFVYLDDVLFSGSRIGNDLSAWITGESPSAATVHVVVIAAHRFGEWKCRERLKKAASDVGKRVQFHFWSALLIENRLSYRNVSEVLWPVTVPNDDALSAYLAEETRFPFRPRVPGGQSEHRIFSSEEGRQLLERELLLAGIQIRSLSQHPSPAMRPLGFSPFGLGFGSTIVTYRNCPNNAPLALWWGDPEADQNHPFSGWWPLVQRKAYAR